MGRTLDIGRRIELLSMDRHCQNISLGLYCCDVDGAPQVLVHTYASAAEAQGRVEFIRQALIVMAGLESVHETSGLLHFPCQCLHERALKRAFLDVCKLETNTPLEMKPLTVFDKKASCGLTALKLGDGVYQMNAEQRTEVAQKRTAALAGGFVKLCDMETPEGQDNQVAFSCQTNHDALIGLLMFRAQNVRNSMREEQLAASRGSLSAPSQQK